MDLEDFLPETVPPTASRARPNVETPAPATRNEPKAGPIVDEGHAQILAQLRELTLVVALGFLFVLLTLWWRG